ncbi:MAG: type VI secretion system contractile sheath large subunit [Pseudomonadota bacterium]|nr:type VI secretion system contractile sheath large subunit [Pseudomonadota bacterium]
MADDDWTPDFGTLDAEAPPWLAKRPVRIAVLGDFSAGAASGRLETGDDLARRKMIPVEFDSLEDMLARLEVKLALPIGGGGDGVEVEFGELDSFHPDSLYRELPMFRSLVDLRKRLNNTATFAKAAAEVQAMGRGGKRRASRSGSRRSKSGAPAADAKLSDFARLVGIAPDVRVDTPVDALLKRILGPFVTQAPDPKRDALVAIVDSALSDAMRTVLHHAEFQNLEALWRGMDMLLRRVETGPSLQVLLVDMSAEEFAADLSSASDLSETGLYSMLVDKPSQDKGGGVSLILGLYQFEPTPPHAELLGRMAKVAKLAGAPFITSISADAFADRRNAPHPLMAQALEALRELPDASHLVLLAPRFMLRHPYGKKSDPITAFTFEEFTPEEGLRGMLWGHPALLAASVLAAPTGSTLSIGDLPFHYVVDGDGDQVALPTTERLVNLAAAEMLRRVGIDALMAHKGQPELRIAGLDAMNGDPIVLAGMPKPAARMSFTTSVQGKMPDPQRAAKGGKSKAKVVEDDEKVAASDADETSDSAASDAAPDSPGDSSLDDLLASLGDDSGTTGSDADAADSAEAPAEEGEMDPDLAALLKSLE